MATPSQMYDHRLNPLKSWPNQYALDKAKELADGETDVVAGRVIYIDPTLNKFKLGLPGNQMPIYAWNGFAEFDTVSTSTDYNISNYGNKKGLSGLVATGAFELQTTEFVSGETYYANLPLTVENATGDDKGKVKPGEYYTDTICGIVSDGSSTNIHGKSIVTFWSYFLPSSGGTVSP